jgi:hypothetical protein
MPNPGWRRCPVSWATAQAVSPAIGSPSDAPGPSISAGDALVAVVSQSARPRGIAQRRRSRAGHSPDPATRLRRNPHPTGEYTAAHSPDYRAPYGPRRCLSGTGRERHFAIGVSSPSMPPIEALHTDAYANRSRTSSMFTPNEVSRVAAGSGSSRSSNLRSTC